MKIWVCRTSDFSGGGVKRDFKSLDECIETLEKQTGEREFVVSRPNDMFKSKEMVEDIKECTWQVEIYDTWRE